MLTVENLVSFREKALCAATSPGIREAYFRFSVFNGKLEVYIAGKLRPVFYKGWQRNIELDFDTTTNKWSVVIDYGPGLNSSTFFVGEKEADVIDCILVWLICPQDAHFSSYTAGKCFNAKCHPPPRRINYSV